MFLLLYMTCLIHLLKHSDATYQIAAFFYIYMAELKQSKVSHTSSEAQLYFSLELMLLSPSSFQTTGPQSSERASKARGGPVCLAQHGRRGRR